MSRTKVNHIIRAEHGGTDYPGAVEAGFNVNEGKFVPDMNEAELYPQATDNVGVSDGFPCDGTLQHEDVSSFATLLSAAAGTLTVIGKAASAANNEQFSVANALFNRGTLDLSRQRDAKMSMSFFGYSADGSATRGVAAV